MKILHRKIVVDNQTYTWGPGRNNLDGDGSNYLKIWKDRKIIYRELVEGSIQITPLFVRKIIDKIKNNIDG